MKLFYVLTMLSILTPARSPAQLPIEINLTTPEDAVRSYWRYRDFKDTVNLANPLTFNDLFTEDVLRVSYTARTQLLRDMRLGSNRSWNVFAERVGSGSLVTVSTKERSYLFDKIIEVRYQLKETSGEWKIEARLEKCELCDGIGKWVKAGDAMCTLCRGEGWHKTLLP